MENGTCECLPNGNKWSGGNPVIKVACNGGYLIAYQSGDPGIYDEISVDFVSDDGRLLQLATIGRDEEDEDDGWGVSDRDAYGYQPMHVYAHDGVIDDVASTQYVTISESSPWYEN